MIYLCIRYYSTVPYDIDQDAFLKGRYRYTAIAFIKLMQYGVIPPWGSTIQKAGSTE
jgi:hypothetical protein